MEDFFLFSLQAPLVLRLVRVEVLALLWRVHTHPLTPGVLDFLRGKHESIRLSI